jgi:hypothetical protein
LGQIAPSLNESARTAGSLLKTPPKNSHDLVATEAVDEKFTRGATMLDSADSKQ